MKAEKENAKAQKAKLKSEKRADTMQEVGNDGVLQEAEQKASDAQSDINQATDVKDAQTLVAPSVNEAKEVKPESGNSASDSQSEINQLEEII